jgi:hypothetical protein
MGTGAEDRTSELIAAVHLAIEFLRTYDRNSWADRFEESLADIENGESRGTARLIGLFGGMGSVNDIWISAGNGDRIGAANEGSVNQRLRGLLGDVYEPANQIEHDVSTQ